MIREIVNGALVRLDGAFAAYMRVPVAMRHLVHLGNIDPRSAGPLSDAGGTTYNAVQCALPFLVPGTTAVVIGAGGLGQMAIQILKALTPAVVIAMDTTEDRLANAKRLGADETMLSGPEAAKQVRDITGGRGADVVLDIVGINPTLQMSVEMVSMRGLIVFVGRGGGTLQFHPRTVPNHTAVVSPYYCSFQDLIEVTELAKAGKVQTMVEYFPLDKAFDVLQLMKEGKLKGRAVLTPNG
jgi:propanol-preferring alcohol dehydrogenase